MGLILANDVRLEISPNLDRRTIRVWVANREVPLDRSLLAAVLAMAAGGDVAPDHLRLLAAVGVLARVSDALPPDRSMLHPSVSLELGFGAQHVEVAGYGRLRVKAELSHPITLFMAPEILGPLQQLGGTLGRAWHAMLRATVSAERALDHAGIARVLASITRNELARRPGLAAVLEIAEDEPLLLRPRGPLQDEALHYPLHTVTFHGDREPALATAPPVHFRLSGPGDLSALGKALGQLSVGVASHRVQAEGSPAIAVLLRQLASRALLVDAPEVRPLAAAPGSVVHLGHATLLANLGGHVLVDPWFFAASRGDPTPPPSIGDLPPIAAVFLTHHHWDHVDLATLLQLPSEIPIYIPEQPSDCAIRPRTDRLLELLGFGEVRTLAHGQAVELSDGRVVAAPFTGEDPTHIGFGANTYVLEHRGRACLVQVDSGPTVQGHSILSDGTLAALRAEHGPLSPVFATRRQERGTAIEHGWPFLLLPSDRWTRPTENCCTGAGFLAELARAAGASELVLYSEGGADWYPANTDFLRGAGSEPLDLSLTWLWDDLEAISAALHPIPTRLSRPYDTFVIGGTSGA